MGRYKAVLCDDDEIITQGLREMIPWEQLNISLCGCAYDGLQAKKLVEQYSPEILISDIRMPFLDGLQLTKAAKNRDKNIKVIIISGYDDFQYAQDAIKVGAMDYILKPIDVDSLIEQLRRAVAGCEKQEEQDSAFRENQEYQEKQIINALIYKGAEAVCDKLSKLPSVACGVFIIGIDNFEHIAFRITEEERHSINEVFYRCIQQQLTKGVVIFEQRPGVIGCYVLGENMEKVKEMMNYSINTIQYAFEKACVDFTITFACSNIHQNLRELQQAYDEASRTMRERFVFPVNSVLHFSQVVYNNDPGELKDFEAILAKLDFPCLIKQGNKAEIDAQLDRLKLSLLSIGAQSYLYMKIVTGNIYARLLRELYQLGIGEDELGFNMLDEYKKSAEPQSMDTAMEQLKQSIHRIVDAMEKNSTNYSKMMSKAIAYIDEHYMDHDLSMDNVAQYVHMSPSYFSVIFKAEQGIAFTDYLIQLRIEKSKEFMRHTDLKVFEIAYKVGYDTAAYFSAAFKKVTGYSPTEYREQLKNNKKV